MRNLSSSWRRALTAAGVAGALAATAVAGATDASASTIPDGHIQLCAQGSYGVFLHILSVPIPNSAAITGSVDSIVLHPNEGWNSCWWTPWNTHGQRAQVDIVEVRPDGSQFYIGSKWWNSDTGLGIGAEGSESHPWLQTW